MKDQAAQLRTKKCRALRNAIIGMLFFLGAYVFLIQVSDSPAHVASSNRQLSRLTHIPARRGAILDRNGTILNVSIPQYNLAIRLDKLRDPRDTRTATLNKAQAAIADLAVFLGGDYYLHRPSVTELEQHIARNAPLPFLLWSNLDARAMALISASRARFPFAEITLNWYRQYEQDNTAALLRGFVRQDEIVNANPPLREEDNPTLLNYVGWIGATGVERLRNPQLTGQHGYQKLLTDVLSFRHQTVEVTRAVPGEPVTLTIDITLQKLAESLIQRSGHPGAIVVLNAFNGDILTMASYPMHHLPPQRTDTAVPGAFLNRAIAGFYPPGSTIKPFFALAVLEFGLFDPEETFFCPGYYELEDGRHIKCSSTHGHGNVNVTQALAMSCNTFFCEAAVRLRREGFLKLLSRSNYNAFFGQKTNIFNGREEIPGNFYSPRWIEKTRFEDVAWHEHDAALAGIGQGGWIVTPLQMARYACAITTGRLFQPRLIQDNLPPQVTPVSWPDQARIPVLQGLLDCVETNRGTGRRLRIPSMTIYAKTGTAEHVPGKQPHAWMFAVAPADNPKIVVSCVLEEGGHGGEAAAPLVRTIILAALRSLE